MNTSRGRHIHTIFIGPLAGVPGWIDQGDDTGFPHQELTYAMLFDQAEQWARDVSLDVAVLVEECEADHESVRVVNAGTSGVMATVRDFVQNVFATDHKANVVLIPGNNPLLAPGHVRNGIDLLCHEEEVVVIGESQLGTKRGIMWVGMNCYASCLLDHHSPWWNESFDAYRLLSESQALVFSTRTFRKTASVADIVYLRHEIERRKLLGEWYPPRTDALLALYPEHRSITSSSQ
jgi:hypothetical protein